MSTLNVHFSLEAPKIIIVLDKVMTSLQINNEEVEIDMDNWSCSLAFESESLRDKIFDKLNEK